jgi:hypothetical protein
MNVYLKDGRSSDNTNDCIVIALAYAFDLDYPTAYNMCKKAGRVHNKGFSLRDVLRVNQFKKSRQLMGRRVGYHGRPGMTVGRFQKTHTNGIYIIRVGGHIFTMIDGNVLNQTNPRDKISFYYYISKPKTHDSTFGQQEVDDTDTVRSQEESNTPSGEQLDS